MPLTKLDMAILTGIFLLVERDINYRAWMYGNEVEVGKAIKQCKTPRSEIFVTVLTVSLN